jgi:hypothetical protein
MHFLFLLVFIFSSIAKAQTNCDRWFLDTNAKPGAKDCIQTCSVFRVDMGTFDCPSKCERYCNSQVKEKCIVDNYWLEKLNAESKPFQSLTPTDKVAIARQLSKMPKSFRPKSLKAIVRASQPDFISPQNPASSSDEYIILFPSASITSSLDRVLFHEIVHHLTQREWANLFTDYKKKFGWIRSGRIIERAGNFVDPDGRISAEEDFANNVEYYIFDSKKLSQISPQISTWIDKRLKSKLKMEKGCHENNKN